MSTAKPEDDRDQATKDTIVRRKKMVADAAGSRPTTLKGVIKALISPGDGYTESAQRLTTSQIREARNIQLKEGLEASDATVLAIAQILAINNLTASQRFK